MGDYQVLHNRFQYLQTRFQYPQTRFQYLQNATSVLVQVKIKVP